MKCIGINTLPIQPGRNRGVQTYVDELIPALVRLGQFRLKVFTSRVNQSHFEKLEGVEIVPCPVDGRNRATRVLYEQFRLQRQAKVEECDLLFFPGYLGPVIKTMPFVVAVHDMQFRDIPAGLGVLFNGIYRFIVPRALRNSERVVTLSEFSKSRICHYVRIDPGKIVVTPLGGLSEKSGANRESLEEEESLLLNEILSDERPYFISVSSSFPHKNIDGLVRGFLRFNRDHRFRLLLVGTRRDDGDECIISTGYVSNEMRDRLYAHAFAYVFASRYEGFGIPILEAMGMNLPVLSSDAASLPEVGGDACLYFSPDDEHGLVAGLQQLAENSELRAELVDRGRNRLNHFSWEKTAGLVGAVFHEVLSQP